VIDAGIYSRVYDAEATAISGEFVQWATLNGWHPDQISEAAGLVVIGVLNPNLRDAENAQANMDAFGSGSRAFQGQIERGAVRTVGDFVVPSESILRRVLRSVGLTFNH